MYPRIAERISAAVDAAFDRQLEFTAELIREPSLRAEEAGAQELLYRAMEARGLEMDRWEIDSEELRSHVGYGPSTVSYENSVNVVGTYKPRTTAGRSLILNGHVDVVPAGPEGTWSRSPWDAQIVDGWMYGRGSGDMKAGLAANIFALDAVRAAGLAPTAEIIVQSVVEEECTGNGSLAALLRGYTADAVIIPEPEENMLVRANVGVLWFKVRVEGEPTHPREMTAGFNAIDAAYTVMSNLRELEERWNRHRTSHRYFEDLEHPINFNFGTIIGGDWPSSVPAWCEIDVRVAIYPGMTADQAWHELQQCLDSTGLPLTATKTGFYSEGYVLEEGSEAETVLAGAHREAFGEDLQSFTTPGYLDGRVFTLYGDTPTLVYGPVSEAIHGFDERVDIESVRRITKAIALFIAEWCGVEEATAG
ncbi:acetylornithine deacetylase [Arthrobacter crystallopoietes BAB-32]|uniref:Acetylornithine deacetylase n=1 Tax=Arthrobacter crystallopoietes BAB-32 TaxID=1246476 RepID=N1V3J2_9MICC|nr:ArgE/DapE family deacylase [Arthrobacter crystallopoietes]EMY34594.1 acetylornithine deacetylase [Arthrobacter crystallopoietes BAB-32]